MSKTTPFLELIHAVWAGAGLSSGTEISGSSLYGTIMFFSEKRGFLLCRLGGPVLEGREFSSSSFYCVLPPRTC